MQAGNKGGCQSALMTLAGERRAIVFTAVEACRRRGIDPFEYLRDVLTRMPQMEAKDYATLAPAAWAEARQLEKPEKKDRKQ